MLQETAEAELTEHWSDGQGADGLTSFLITKRLPHFPGSESRQWSGVMWTHGRVSGETVKAERDEPIEQNLNVLLNNA